MTVALRPPTRLHARAVNPSESASLNGQKAKTPIIAGSIVGGVMGLAWIIGFSIYFYKRARRKRRKAEIAAGMRTPRPEPEVQEKIIIPPDPAVLLGQREPGERIDPAHLRDASSSSFSSKLRRLGNGSGTENPSGDLPPPEADTPFSSSLPRVNTTATTHISDEILVPPHTHI